MRTTTAAVVTAVVLVLVPKMLQVKCSLYNVMYMLLLYTRTAVVVVDAHNEVPCIISKCYTHDDIREYI